MIKDSFDDSKSAIEKAVSQEGEVCRGPIDVDATKKRMAQIRDPQDNVFGLLGDLL